MTTRIVESPESDIYSLGLVMLEVLSRKRVRNLENHSNVVQCLNELEIENETIKRVLPLMLEEEVDKRPSAIELLEDESKIEIDKEVVDFYKIPNRYDRLFPYTIQGRIVQARVVLKINSL
ncbi:predicted protein [Naegleria gruberi]|uniref:Predicted protein n=1 Tax=Naegleria gruberi TaxID=5762 RepID=D2VI46_NAEGR|nr:uncharacterized protein NAEGRDRAFT_68557 [Naegleria gruberi]EFC43526.1 predicted protein [Naegleria gruberi]|eukprot:XP_002676270.1 predicted protein [Naegleria gruberi strain NEG-M]